MNEPTASAKSRFTGAHVALPWLALATLAAFVLFHRAYGIGTLIAMIGSHYVLLVGMAMGLGALGVLRYRSKRPAAQRVCSSWIAAGAVALVALAVYGETHLPRTYRARARKAWAHRTQPADLSARLRSGMTSEQALAAMAVPRDSDSVFLTLLRTGLTPRALRIAMGVSVTLIMPSPESNITHFVWCRPLCSTLGCCDGAVLLRFEDDALQSAGIYDPSSPGASDISYDVARSREVVNTSGKRRVFLPGKTLEAIQKAGPPNIVLIAAADLKR